MARNLSLNTLHPDLKYRTSVWLRRFAKITAIATLLLIFAGGLVTSTGSGLSVPDWPNTYGQFMFAFPLSDMVGGILYEHSHRIIATVVGLFMLILAIWLWKVEPRRWLKRLGWIALAAVIAQGVLGGITVLTYLPLGVSMAHGILAQTFFCITIAIAYFLSREWKERQRLIRHYQNRSLLKWSKITAGLIYLQLILGALMRHSESGLAILDFPLTGGRIIPDFMALMINVNDKRFELGWEEITIWQVGIHFLHRLGAIAVSVGIVGMFIKVVKYFSKSRKLLFPATVLMLLLVAQITLAAYVIWSLRNPIITTFHVWVGALMLGIATFLSLRCYSLFRIPAHYNKLDEKKIQSIPPETQTLSFSGKVGALLELTKPTITLMVMVSTFIGFYLGLQSDGASITSKLWLLIHLLIGTALVAGGVGTLNEYMERDLDARMKRTNGRPLPSRRLTPQSALVFGVSIAAIGVFYLMATTNIFTSLLAATTLLIYLFIYTPMKRKTVLNTIVGAVPGALPPIGGWLAATGEISLAAWLVFGIMFLWQIPHFLSLAWIYRKDYAKVGFKMLTVTDSTGEITARYMVIFSSALLVCSLSLTLIGLTSQIYFVGALFLGLFFLLVSVWAAWHLTNQSAKRLLLTSVFYLPALTTLLIIDRGLFF